MVELSADLPKKCLTDATSRGILPNMSLADERSGVRRLRATAHPVRLEMLSLLTGAELSAAEVARELGITQANASYHLRLLRTAGLLEEAGQEKVNGGTAKRYRALWDRQQPRDPAHADADPDPEARHAPGTLHLARVVGDLLHQLQRRAHRTLGVVLVRGRSAEQREHAVPREILDHPAERLDRVDHARDGVADDHLQLFGIEPFGEDGGPHQIGEDRRDHASLLADLARILGR